MSTLSAADYHDDLLGALSVAALGDEATARRRLLIVINRLEVSQHPAAINDLRLALGASALIEKRCPVAATLLAGLRPEAVSTNLLGLLTRHYQAQALAQVGEAAWHRCRATSTREIDGLIAARPPRCMTSRPR
jgi:hypothetical protein